MNIQSDVDAFLKQIGSNAGTNKNKKKKKPSTEKNVEEKPIEEKHIDKKVEEEKKIEEKPTGPKKPISKMAKLALEHKKRIEEEAERQKKIEEEILRKELEEQRRIEEEQKIIEEKKNKKKEKNKEKILEQKKSGTYKTKKEKEREKYEKFKLEQMTKERPTITHTIDEPKTTVLNYGTVNHKYKSIVSCIMGHVDTGKTSLLDKIRDTKIQKGEVGGITQQIGATNIPRETLIEKSMSFGQYNIEVPALLMIDTPGHEAFGNLRKVGSNICDIAVLVIDLVHGLEPQTIESMNLLKDTNTPFIIALNKIDRLYGWIKNYNSSFKSTFSKQNESTRDEFDTRFKKITTQIMEQGFNVKLYWENDSPDDTISVCPTSAVTGEGLSDLIAILIKWSQERLQKQITYSESIECILMENAKIDGHGLTLDVILLNGELKVGDIVNISTTKGLKRLPIKSLLTAPPNHESRVKSEYIHHDTIKGATGLKLVLVGLDDMGIVGTNIVLADDEELPTSDESVVDTKFKLDEKGVSIHASTSGSLEALVNYLRNECNPPVPISSTNIGKVMKKDVVRISLLNDKMSDELKTILAFNVDVDEEAEEEAKKCGLKIFDAEVIYHLFDKFTKYKDEIMKRKKKEYMNRVMFPCILKILPDCIFNKRDPLLFGVYVEQGNIHIGTDLIDPITNVYIGKVTGIQSNHKDIEKAHKSQSVCLRIVNTENQHIEYGKHFDHKNKLCTRITRQSLDIIKTYYKDECTKEDVILLVKLKGMLGIK
jgi:translation initiation factor 5B